MVFLVIVCGETGVEFLGIELGGDMCSFKEMCVWCQGWSCRFLCVGRQVLICRLLCVG